MPIASVTMGQIEGLIGSGLRGLSAAASGPRAPQHVSLWAKLMREVMFSQGLRDATDWTLTGTLDTVEAGATVDATGGTVYGLLIDSIYDVANEPLCVLLSNLAVTLTATTVDLGSDTVGLGDSAAAGDSEYGVIVKIQPSRPAGDQNPIFAGFVFPAGLVFDAGIFVAADGEESTAPTANDIRTFVVYRDTAEVQMA